MATSSNPFGSGPPLRTPAFELNFTLGGRDFKFLLYWEKPWVTWLNSIQVQANQSADLEILNAFNDDNSQGAAIENALSIAEQALAEASTARTTAQQATDALLAILGEAPRTSTPSIADLEQLAAVEVNARPGSTDADQLVAAVILRRAGSGHVFIQDTHANAALYPAAAYPDGSLRRETDRTVLFQALAGVWIPIAGTMRETLANIPVDLGTSDEGFLFYATDYSHTWRWDGAGWEWAPGDPGSGFYMLFESGPAGYGAAAWQLMNGATVAQALSDATTANITLDDLTTAAYLKGGVTSAAVAAAGGLTASVSAGTPAGNNNNPATGNNSANQEVQAGVGTTVAADTHTHTTTAPTFTGTALAGHDHGPNTLELRRKQARLYFRR